MAWNIKFIDHGQVVGWYEPLNLSFGIRNSDAGDMTCEIGLAQDGLRSNDVGKGLRRASIVPDRTDYYLYRNKNLITSGIVRSRNLSMNRDTCLFGGKDWIDYLKRRVYPFDPVQYVEQGEWALWPKQWGVGTSLGPDGLPEGEDLTLIAEDILEAMLTATIADTDTPGNIINGADVTPRLILANPPTGTKHRYKILPADQTFIFDHVRTLSLVEGGFEFDILPDNLEFKMYAGGRDGGVPVYSFTVDEQIEDFDWTDEGPLATVTLVYGAGSGIKRGVVRTHKKSVQLFRWTDRIADAGNVGSLSMLQGLAAGEEFADRFPRKKLSLGVFDPELLTPNFYTGGRPRSLIGNRIQAIHNFAPYHTITAHYTVMGINWDVDESGNEHIDFEIDMINDPDLSLGTGGGGFEGL